MSLPCEALVDKKDSEITLELALTLSRQPMTLTASYTPGEGKISVVQGIARAMNFARLVPGNTAYLLVEDVPGLGKMIEVQETLQSIFQALGFQNTDYDVEIIQVSNHIVKFVVTQAASAWNDRR